MKKYIVLIFIMLSIFKLNAQPTTIYFESITKNTSIGTGFRNGKIIVSIIQRSKKKEFNNFNLSILTSEDNIINLPWEVDTIFHFNENKLYAHEADFILDRMEFDAFCFNAKARDKIIINNDEYNAVAFVSILRKLQYDYSKPIFTKQIWFNPNGFFIKNKNKDIPYIRTWFK